MPSLLLPDAQPILTALAILALTAACRFGFAVVTRLLGTSKRLLWPAAGAMASLPFVLREPLLAWWGGTYADAQLGSFLAATAFAWCFFRAIERSVGTTPVGAAASLAEWIFYMSADVDPRYGDGRPLRPPPGKLQSQLAKLCATYAATAAFVSAIEPFGFRPTAAVCEACGVSGPLAAALVRVGDNLSGTVLIYLFLSLLLTLGSILVLAQGHDPIDGFDNPVFKSCSPREFWGRRWNLQANILISPHILGIRWNLAAKLVRVTWGLGMVSWSLQASAAAANLGWVTARSGQVSGRDLGGILAGSRRDLGDGAAASTDIDAAAAASRRVRIAPPLPAPQVNAMLKRSCYKPLAGAGLAAPLATLATFGASAGFHEYQFALSMPGYRPARYPYRCHYCCYRYSHHHHCHPC
mmetsp:Transcript_8957/g.29577  ORF Transcript_8957/g.29577 Transcript_8957/m.29577 type:complete len:411 (+) Transcript_8957:100-1332(+)